MFDKMKQMMAFKQQAEALKKQLDETTVEINDVNGIRIVISGSQHFQSVEIDDGLLGPEKKTRLEAELLRAFNAAIKKSQTVASQKMAAVMPRF